MKAHALEIEGLKLIELDVYKDQRGFFCERFKEKEFASLGLPTRFVQDNHSFSLPKVLRGLHYQTNPNQGKLVGVTRGRIWDVAVDIRKGSATYGQHFAIELSGENGRLLWLPGGFAHGFCVLGSEPADVVYKVDGYFNPNGDAGLHWADPDLAIPWPINGPIISDKDNKLGSFKEFQSPF